MVDLTGTPSSPISEIPVQHPLVPLTVSSWTAGALPTFLTRILGSQGLMHSGVSTCVLSISELLDRFWGFAYLLIVRLSL